MPESERPPRWRDLLQFTNALRKQVVALVCGGVLTAALIIAQGFGWQIKPASYGVVLCVFFLIAAFGAWFEERRNVETLRSRYGLVLNIEQIISPLKYRHKDNNRQLCALLMIVRINNSGAPTSLTGWRAHLKPSLEETAASLQPAIIGRDVDFGESVQYGPEDDLMQKTAETTVPQGSIMHGVILCSGDPGMLENLKTGAHFDLSCFDVTGNRYESAFDLNVRDDEPTFFPGLGRGDGVRAKRESERAPAVTIVHEGSPSGIPSVFDVPSIVITFLVKCDEADEENFGEVDCWEYLSFANVGPVAATNVTLRPIKIMNREITVPEIPVLPSNGPAEEVMIYGLREALFHARKKMPHADGEPMPLIRIKLTLEAGMWAQHEGMQWEYALSSRYGRDISIKRITPGSQQEWTGFDAIAE